MSYVAVFQKLLSIAPSKGVRVIAPNRRPYPGSTSFTDEETRIFKGQKDRDKDEWMKTHGHHVAQLIDTLIRRHDLPPVSPDGQTGGVAILGWSLGAGDVLTSIAHAETLPSNVLSHFVQHVRALILYGMARLTTT